ncbi:flagellar basal body P-ring formation chaperone FlgA [Lichenicoccus sp.]|uniref:flagellar basal body P-ring formation chaperone FlgA n=1 Tax=Lichenicoccus sp. TaxID=2781899 RepID=UPI003D0E447F
MMGVGLRMACVMVALALGLAASTQVAGAAQPRTIRVVTSSTVNLSDLFTGLEPGQDCEIGPGPAAGGRITVEQPQLAAIAEQFGVEWQPGVVPAQVIIERKARVVDHDAVVALIRKSLGQSQALHDPDVNLSSDAPIMVPAEMTASPQVETMEYDTNTGRFVAGLLLQAPGTDAVHVRIAGTAIEMVEVPVFTRIMGTGSIVAGSDLQLQRLRKRLVGDGTVLDAENAVGLALKRQTMPGVPILIKDLGRPTLVSRGMTVLLRLDGPGLAITAKGEAIEAGGLGERIHVLNITSRAILMAQVIAPGVVQVDAQGGSSRVSPPRSGLPPLYSLEATPPSGQRGFMQ